MNIFGKKSSSGERPFYETNYLGFWIKVYPNRVDFKAGAGSESIPISQIASVHQAMMGLMKVIIETAGGKKYQIPTTKKKEVQQAIYDAQAKISATGQSKSSEADEVIKLNELREKGILSQEEFDKKKKQILGL